MMPSARDMLWIFSLMVAASAVILLSGALGLVLLVESIEAVESVSHPIDSGDLEALLLVGTSLVIGLFLVTVPILAVLSVFTGHELSR